MYPMYAPGGKIKRGKMIVAHFNPHELNVLDHLQGKKEMCPNTGMRSYSHLEEILKNPHIFRNLMNNVRSGSIKREPSSSSQKNDGQKPHDYHNAELNKMADEGVHGDSELALIGPHTRHTFDSIIAMNGKTPGNNPESGHPHYWELDGFTSGLGQMFSPPTSSMGEMGGANSSINQSPSSQMIQPTPLGNSLGNSTGQSYVSPMGGINPQGTQRENISNSTETSQIQPMSPGLQGNRGTLAQYGRSIMNPSAQPGAGLNGQRMYGMQQRPTLSPQEGDIPMYAMGQYGTPQTY